MCSAPRSFSPIAPRLHPHDPLDRARHRAWVEFASDVLNSIGAFYSAPDEKSLEQSAMEIRTRFEQLHVELGDGPYFAGARFGIVDAAFAPVFRYFDVFDTIDRFGFFDGLNKVTAWREQLARRPSVQGAVRAEYPELLRAFLLARRSALSRRMAPVPA
jgi:glutathione S-transferase